MLAAVAPLWQAHNRRDESTHQEAGDTVPEVPKVSSRNWM
jgi:hypothetical protein